VPPAIPPAGKELERKARDDEDNLVRDTRNLLIDLAQQVAVPAARWVCRHDSAADFIRDQNDGARGLRKRKAKAVDPAVDLFRSAVPGIEQVGCIQRETVDEQKVGPGAMLLDRSCQFERLFHGEPLVRALVTMALDFPPHRLIAGVGRGDKDDFFRAFAKLLRVTAFAAACTAQHERQRIALRLLHAVAPGALAVHAASLCRAGVIWGTHTQTRHAESGDSALQLSHRS
jgi:hypothetical protein